MVIGRSVGARLLLDAGAQLVAPACQSDYGSYLLLLLVSQGVVRAHVLIEGINRLVDCGVGLLLVENKLRGGVGVDVVVHVVGNVQHHMRRGH